MALFNRKKKEEKKEEVSKKPAVKVDVKKEEKKETKKPVEGAERSRRTAKKSKSTKSADAEKKASAKKVTGGFSHKILVRPLISEKATYIAHLNKYSFEVSKDANKASIKRAVRELYGVLPISVNIVNKSGKDVRFGRHKGRTKDTKKAIVTLKKGDNIRLYEGI